MWHRSFGTWLAVAVGLASTALSPGCSRPPDSSPSPGAEDKPGFDRLLETHAPVIDQFPNHPQSEEVLAQLVDAAVHQKMVSESNAREELMLRFPDHNIGLYLLDQCYDALADTRPEDALALCRRIHAAAPGTPIDTAAFDKELGQLRARGPEGFLAACREALRENASDPRARVALFRRAEFYRDAYQMKHAARDYLRFWSQYPDKVEAMALDTLVSATLRNAGLLFEADLLSTSPLSSEVPRRLWQELDPAFSEALATTPGADPGPLATYLRFAPDLDTILRIIDPPSGVEDLGDLDKARLLSRLGRLAVEDLHPDRTCQAYEGLSEVVRTALAGPPQDEATLSELGRCCAMATTNLVKMFGAQAYTRPSHEGALKRTTTKAQRIAAALNDLYLVTFERAADAGWTPDAAVFAEAVIRHVDFSKRFSSRSGVVKAYRCFLDHCPESERAPEFLIQMGDYYKDVMNMPEEAAKTYAEMYARYPDRPQAEQAAIKEGLALYEAQEFGDAYERLQLFLADHPESDRAATAKYASCLCEAALGASRDAEQHMAQLAEEHPKNTLAARALYWIASNKLSRQEYEEAKTVFLDLSERYPESPYAAKAREYVARLDEVAARSGT